MAEVFAGRSLVASISNIYLVCNAETIVEEYLCTHYTKSILHNTQGIPQPSNNSRTKLDLPLHSPHPNKRTLPPKTPPTLQHNHSCEIPQQPITAMRAQHSQILYLQRSTPVFKHIINLPIIVQQKHALFSNFLLAKIMSFEFHVRW